MCEDDLHIVEVVSRFDRSREARCFLLSDGHVANVVGASVESFSIVLRRVAVVEGISLRLLRCFCAVSSPSCWQYGSVWDDCNEIMILV